MQFKTINIVSFIIKINKKIPLNFALNGIFGSILKYIIVIFQYNNYTLNLKCITSPSCTMYSLPSKRILPFSFAPASPFNAT